MTLIFKVNRQGQKIDFSFFDLLDPKNVRIDTKIKSVLRLQPEITKVIQKGVWPWISRSSNEDRIFSLSPLDSLTPKTYPYVIFLKNSYGKTKIQGGGGTHPPLRSPKVDFYLRSPRVNPKFVNPKFVWCNEIYKTLDLNSGLRKDIVSLLLIWLCTRLIVYLMLLGSSRPYPRLILEESGR